MNMPRVLLRSAKNRLREVVGAIVDVTMPGLAMEIATGTNPGHAAKLKRAILYARLRRGERRNDARMIEEALKAFWLTESEAGFYSFTENFEVYFLGRHYRAVEAMAALVAANPRLRGLVEIGCGDGRVLAHCAEHVAGLQEFTGLDINAPIIARNAQTFTDRPELRFVHTDAKGWLAENASDGMVLMSYGGVMEYFSGQDLAEIFGRLGRYRDTAVVLVEPVDPAHDLATDTRSHVFGRERSFSHNHRALLTDAGFSIVFAEEMYTDRIRWVLIVAATNALAAEETKPPYSSDTHDQESEAVQPKMRTRQVAVE